MDTPKNLEEAIEKMKSNLSDEQIEVLREAEEDDFTAMTHMSSGRAIRNSWGLWGKETEISKWFIRQGIQHADDKSGILFTSLVRDIQNKPIKLQEQIEYYRNYWKEMESDPDDLVDYDVDDVLDGE